MSLAFVCPECQSPLQIQPVRVESIIHCPACRAAIIIPALPVAKLISGAPSHDVVHVQPAIAPDSLSQTFQENEPFPEDIINSGYGSTPRRRRRGMRAGPIFGFFVASVALIAVGIVAVVLIKQRSKDLETPVVKHGANTAGPDGNKNHQQDDVADAVALISGSICSILAVLGCVAIYLAPWLIALSRRHTNSSGILALNFFLGWTGYFWVLALIWAVWNHAPRYHVHRHYRG